MTFRVGQKVVYVGGLHVDPYDDEPSRDEVYTISWIGAVEPTTINVDLLELPSPGNDDLYRPCRINLPISREASEHERQG